MTKTFDTGAFRKAAARFIKYLMRARLLAETGTFSDQQLDAWELRGPERRSAPELLDCAEMARRDVGALVEMCDSGGIPIPADDDPFTDVKEAVAFFIPDPLAALPLAMERVRAGVTVDWAGLADWTSLDRIREMLDELPELELGTAEDSASVSADRQSEMLAKIELLTDEETRETAKIATAPKIDIDTKMKEISRLDRRCAGFTSVQWAELLGCSEGWVRKQPYWKTLNGKHRGAD